MASPEIEGKREQDDSGVRAHMARPLKRLDLPFVLVRER